MGLTAETFHSFGRAPCLIDLLKRRVTPGAIEWTVALSMVADIPSGPLALVVSSESNSSSTCSSVHSISEGHSLEVR